MKKSLRLAAIASFLAAPIAAGLACSKSDPPPAANMPIFGSARTASSDSSGRLRFQPGAPRNVKPIALASAVPIPAASVEAAVNPDGKPPYTGPVGTVQGLVKFKGEQPDDIALQLTDTCAGARTMMGKRFRQGPGRTAADAIVAVTGYQGFVPARAPAMQVTLNDCSFDRRTVALTYGQRIEVFNRDARNSYVPSLLGERSSAQMVAVPNMADPIKLYPSHVGHYLLADQMQRPWMTADVYVLKYATFAITGLDGTFRVEGIPVGTVKVTADVPWLVPAVDQTLEVTIEEGKTANVDFTLDVKKVPVAAASASASSGSSSTPPPVHAIPPVK